MLSDLKQRLDKKQLKYSKFCELIKKGSCDSIGINKLYNYNLHHKFIITKVGWKMSGFKTTQQSTFLIALS